MEIVYSLYKIRISSSEADQVTVNLNFIIRNFIQLQCHDGLRLCIYMAHGLLFRDMVAHNIAVGRWDIEVLSWNINFIELKDHH